LGDYCVSLISLFSLIGGFDSVIMHFQFKLGMSKTTLKQTANNIYVCGKCRTQFMLPMEKSVTFTGACANEIIPNG
jgi:hypothetical protein